MNSVSPSQPTTGKGRGARPFRFGVSLFQTGSRSVWQSKAREADIVGFPLDVGIKPDTEPEQALAERVALVREEVGERATDLELNLLVGIVAVTPDKPDLSALRPFFPGLSEDRLLRLPNVLVGSEHQIAEQLLRYRKANGISYFSVAEPSMAAFAKVFVHLR